MKRISEIFRAAVLTAVLLGVCAVPVSAAQTAGVSTAQNTEAAETRTDCGTLEEAEALAGFRFGIPTALDGYQVRTYSAVPGHLLEADFAGADGDELRMRKEKGTVSADPPAGTHMLSMEFSGIRVTLSMDESGIRSGQWASGDDTCSISSSAGIPILKGIALFTDIACGVAAEDAAITQEGGMLQDPQTGESYSDRVVLINTDGHLTEAELTALLQKYGLSLVYAYSNFTMYALKTQHSLTAEELAALLDGLRAETKVINAMRDGSM